MKMNSICMMNFWFTEWYLHRIYRLGQSRCSLVTLLSSTTAIFVRYNRLFPKIENSQQIPHFVGFTAVTFASVALCTQLFPLYSPIQCCTLSRRSRFLAAPSIRDSSAFWSPLAGSSGIASGNSYTVACWQICHSRKPWYAPGFFAPVLLPPTLIMAYLGLISTFSETNCSRIISFSSCSTPNLQPWDPEIIASTHSDERSLWITFEDHVNSTGSRTSPTPRFASFY